MQPQTLYYDSCAESDCRPADDISMSEGFEQAHEHLEHAAHGHEGKCHARTVIGNGGQTKQLPISRRGRSGIISSGPHLPERRIVPPRRKPTPVETLQRLLNRVVKHMEALQRVRLEGYAMVISELEVEADSSEGRGTWRGEGFGAESMLLTFRCRAPFQEGRSALHYGPQNPASGCRVESPTNEFVRWSSLAPFPPFFCGLHPHLGALQKYKRMLRS